MRSAAPAIVVFVPCLLAAAPRFAAADGAFPDAQTVLAPADRPRELILATNFGLVISEDDGASWQWSCERDANAFGVLYQLGPAPRHRLYTVASDQVVFSDDGSCGWQVAGGALAGVLVIDLFPDAADGDRVLAVGYAGGVYAVFPSGDGGATFGAPIYEAAAGDGIGGVEIARADPRIIYLAMTAADGLRPKLARSGDGGATWTVTDLGAMVGPAIARIIAVDPDDPDVVLLRLIGADGQAIALTRDGGATVVRTLEIDGSFTSYVQLPGGARLVGATIDDNTTAALFRSRDGGATFEAVPSPPRIRALAQRGGVVYAATDNFGDGFAVGASDDEGTTWRGVMSYDQIQAIIPCLRGDAQCQASCQALAGQGAASPGMIWDERVCSAAPDASVTTPAPPGDSGCGCALGPRPGAAAPASLAAAAAAAAVVVRRRRRRRRHRAAPAAAAPTAGARPGG